MSSCGVRMWRGVQTRGAEAGAGVLLDLPIPQYSQKLLTTDDNRGSDSRVSTWACIVTMLHFSYSVEYMKASKKSSHTSTNGRHSSPAAIRTHTAEHVRRPEQRTIHFLTQDELRQL